MWKVNNFIYLFFFSLEALNGGVNLFLNLNMNKELSQKREPGAYVCKETGREFNKVNLTARDNNVYWPANFPKDNVNKNYFITFVLGKFDFCRGCW